MSTGSANSDGRQGTQSTRLAQGVKAASVESQSLAVTWAVRLTESVDDDVQQWILNPVQGLV